MGLCSTQSCYEAQSEEKKKKLDKNIEKLISMSPKMKSTF